MKGLTLSLKEGEHIQLSLPDVQLIYVALTKLKDKQVKLKVFVDCNKKSFSVTGRKLVADIERVVGKL